MPLRYDEVEEVRAIVREELAKQAPKPAPMAEVKVPEEKPTKIKGGK